MAFETHAEGTLGSDGTEQTVAEITEAVRLSGYISLANMQAGDTVVLRQYVKLFDTYERYAEDEYSDVQGSPMVYFTPKEISSGLKVTLRQTIGPSRNFSYKFIKEKVVTVTVNVSGAAVFTI